MQIIDRNHPFFRPVWRRWVTALAPCLWAGVELATGSTGWALLFGALGGYAVWQLIIVGPSDI